MIRGFKTNPKDFNSTQTTHSGDKNTTGSLSYSVKSFEKEKSRQDFVVDWQMKSATNHANIDPNYFH